MHFGGCTATRDGGWVTQQARRASRANAYAERWVRTMRTECLDWLLIWNRTYLERVRRVYVCDYNHQRPHRGLGLAHLRGRIRCPHYLGGARRGVSARPPRGSAPRVLPGRGVNRDLCTLQVEGTQSQRRRVSGKPKLAWLEEIPGSAPQGAAQLGQRAERDVLIRILDTG